MKWQLSSSLLRLSSDPVTAGLDLIVVLLLQVVNIYLTSVLYLLTQIDYRSFLPMFHTHKVCHVCDFPQVVEVGTIRLTVNVNRQSTFAIS